MKLPSIILLCITLIACKESNTQSQDTIVKDKEVENLFHIMQGSYNSASQAEVDSTYYNISLHMYPIWKEKGSYLYVEQALDSNQDKPYRQRIYEVKRIDSNHLGSYIYTIPNDSLWIGKWKNPENFNSLSLSEISLRKGCEVILSKQEDGTYAGSTGKKSCESSLRGATFATSQVTITHDMIISWDRGFDKDGNHVWGAEKGGYIFEKLK